jgi:hypothetical protein
MRVLLKEVLRSGILKDIEPTDESACALPGPRGTKLVAALALRTPTLTKGGMEKFSSPFDAVPAGPEVAATKMGPKVVIGMFGPIGGVMVKLTSRGKANALAAITPARALPAELNRNAEASKTAPYRPAAGRAG